MGGDPYVSATVDEGGGPEASLTPGDRAQVLDPYGDRALLTSAMAKGYDAVPDEERDRLRRYLEAVVAARSAPVHTTVAFNAVYFGYDLGGDGYGGSPLCLDDFPVITFGECAPCCRSVQWCVSPPGRTRCTPRWSIGRVPTQRWAPSVKYRPGCRGRLQAPRARGGRETAPRHGEGSSWSRISMPSARV